MEQWVGILLGFIVAVAIIVAYMYRRSNFDVAPLSVSDQAQVASLNPVEMSTLPLSSMAPQAATTTMMAPPQAATTTMMAPPQAATTTMMAPQAATTTMMAPQAATTTMMAPQAATTTMMAPQAATTTMMAPQVATTTMMAPQAGTTTMMASPEPTAMTSAETDDIEPAYDAKFAEYTPEDDIKVM